MPGDETRVVEPRTAYGWDGWGTCLSWWANTELGRRDDLAAALFGLDPVRVGTTGGEVELPGLGLNIVRYNLGACTWTNGGMVESPTIVRRKQIETFSTPAPDTYLREGMLTVTHEANTVTTLEVEDVQADGVSERKVWPSSGPRPK